MGVAMRKDALYCIGEVLLVQYEFIGVAHISAQLLWCCAKKLSRFASSTKVIYHLGHSITCKKWL